MTVQAEEHCHRDERDALVAVNERMAAAAPMATARRQRGKLGFVVAGAPRSLASQSNVRSCAERGRVARRSCAER
jgi:hypothetical protein